MTWQKKLVWILVSGLLSLSLPLSSLAATTSVWTDRNPAWTNIIILALLFAILGLSILFFYILVMRSNLKSGFSQRNHHESKWLNAMDSLDEPIFMVDLNDNLMQGNRAFYEKIGKSHDEALGINVAQFFHPIGDEKCCQVCQARMEPRDAMIMLDADDRHNHTGWAIEARVCLVRDDQEQVVAILQHFYDVMLTREAGEQLRKSEERYHSLLESTPDPLIVSTDTGKIVMVNNPCERVFGYQSEELLGQAIEILVPEALREQHIKYRDSYSEQPEKRSLNNGEGLFAKCKDGKVIPVEVSLSPWTSGDEMLINSTIHDVTQRKKNECKLKRLASFLHLSPIPIFEMDTSGKVTFLNPKSKELFPELLMSDPFHPILQGIKVFLVEAKQTDKVMMRLIELRDSIYEQQVIYVEEVDMYHVHLWNITIIQRMTEKISHQASHDGLTSLINRREFERRIQQAIRESELEGKSHAFCFIDLDRFKIVNDQCGHPAGDALLKQLAGILKSEIRDSDTLARLGGDEFGLLLTGCDVVQAQIIAEQIRQVVTDYRFLFERKTYSVGASIGLIMLTGECGTLKQVRQAADSACYVAKEEGRYRIHIYKPDDKVLAQHSEYVEWVQRIINALGNNLFLLYSQTIHSLSDERSVMQAVLVRMINDDGELIPPGAFIPAAERYGLMPSIDRWVIQHAFMAIQQGWPDSAMCTINLSAE